MLLPVRAFVVHLRTELQVRLKWVVVSLTLLVPALAGCRTTRPFRSVDSSGLRRTPFDRKPDEGKVVVGESFSCLSFKTDV